MQQKNNSRRIRICAVCFALLIMLIAAATYYFACRGTEYRILDDAEIQQMSARSEYFNGSSAHPCGIRAYACRKSQLFLGRQKLHRRLG